MPSMVFARLCVALLGCAVLAGCDRKDPPSQDPGDPSADVRLTGGERIGWTQPASDAVELSLFQYAVYVDGVRTTLTDVSCSATAGATGFECSAALPPMTPGPHTLELASLVADVSGTLESTRSAPLRVVMTGAGGAASRDTSRDVRTLEGVALVLEQIAVGLREPVDVAAAADGALFIAERGGTVRVFRDGVLAHEPAIEPSSDMAAADGRVLGVSLDAGFEKTHFLYMLYAAAARRGETDILLARFRGVGDRFGERAVLLARSVPQDSTEEIGGALRFGADGKLYVAVGDEILRLNSDATTPDDHVPFTPVYSDGHAMARALVWHPQSSELWVIEGVDPSGGRLATATPSVVEQRRAVTRIAYRLPQGIGPRSAVFYRGDAIPSFRGDLFIAAETGRQLMRLRFAPDDARRIVSVEPLLANQIGPIRSVAEGRDGALYVATDTALYRLRLASDAGR